MMEWDEGWSVCVESLDADHKKMIGLLNRLYDFATAPGDREAFLGMFEEMETYARDHFSREEALLKERNYAHLEEHQKEHRGFEKVLEKLRTRAHQENLAEISGDSLRFLGDWLVDHILGADRAYVPLFQSCGVGRVGPPKSEP